MNQKRYIQLNEVFLICSIFLFILSIPLLLGKLSNLIAGYNTMSSKEKEKYNELKLTRAIGLILFGTAMILLLGAFHIINDNDTILICICEILIGIIIVNQFAKKNND